MKNFRFAIKIAENSLQRYSATVKNKEQRRRHTSDGVPSFYDRECAYYRSRPNIAGVIPKRRQLIGSIGDDGGGVMIAAYNEEVLVGFVTIETSHC